MQPKAARALGLGHRTMPHHAKHSHECPRALRAHDKCPKQVLCWLEGSLGSCQAAACTIGSCPRTALSSPGPGLRAQSHATSCLLLT